MREVVRRGIRHCLRTVRAKSRGGKPALISGRSGK
jgi:hypothetical protein